MDIATTVKQAVAEGLFSSLWIVIVVSAITGGFAAYLGAYLRVKAEHLAKSEDFERLSDQQAAITQRTKSIEAELQKRVHSQNEQFRAEFGICRQLWRLLTVYKRQSREVIRKTVGGGQAMVDENLSTKHIQSAEELVDCLEMNLPFYADEIYAEVSEFLARLDAAVRESSAMPPVVEVRFEGVSLTGSTLERAKALVALNRKSKLLTDKQVAEICKTIRKRLKFEQ
jgi:hypothetical protein